MNLQEQKDTQNHKEIMSEHVDYIEESEDYKTRGGETATTGENIVGNDGELEMDIPEANYPAGKTATAQDADLTAGNIKDGVTLFGVEGTLESGGIAKSRFFPRLGIDDGILVAGVFNRSYPYLSFGKDAGGSPRESAILFRGITIPQGADIKKAIISLYAQYAGSGTVVNVKIHCNEIDAPTMPVNVTEFNALGLTDGTEWHAVPAWIVATWYDTPDIKTEIQEVIDRVGWTFDNNLMVVIKDDASTTNARRIPAAIEDTLGIYKAQLYIEWGV